MMIYVKYKLKLQYNLTAVKKMDKYEMFYSNPSISHPDGILSICFNLHFKNGIWKEVRMSDMFSHFPAATHLLKGHQ